MLVISLSDCVPALCDPRPWLTNVISSLALSAESFSSAFVVEAFWNQSREPQWCSCFMSMRALHPQPFNTFPSISPTISQITYTYEQESILSSGHVSSPYKGPLPSIGPWEGLSPLSFKVTSGISARTSISSMHPYNKLASLKEVKAFPLLQWVWRAPHLPAGEYWMNTASVHFPVTVTNAWQKQLTGRKGSFGLWF